MFVSLKRRQSRLIFSRFVQYCFPLLTFDKGRIEGRPSMTPWGVSFTLSIFRCLFAVIPTTFAHFLRNELASHFSQLDKGSCVSFIHLTDQGTQASASTIGQPEALLITGYSLKMRLLELSEKLRLPASSSRRGIRHKSEKIIRSTSVLHTSSGNES